MLLRKPLILGAAALLSVTPEHIRFNPPVALAQPTSQTLIEYELDQNPSSQAVLEATIQAGFEGTLSATPLIVNKVPSPGVCNMGKVDDSPDFGDFYIGGWPGPAGRKNDCNIAFIISPEPGHVWKPTRLILPIMTHCCNQMGPTIFWIAISADGFQTWLDLKELNNFLPAGHQCHLPINTERVHVLDLTLEILEQIGFGAGFSSRTLEVRLIGSHNPGGGPGGFGGYSNSPKFPGESSNIFVEGMVAVEPLFSSDAANCQQAIGKSTHRLLKTVHGQHVRCLNQEAKGRLCNVTRRDAAITARIARTTAKLDARCTLANYVELGFDAQSAEELRAGIVQEAIDRAVDLVRATYPGGYANLP